MNPLTVIFNLLPTGPQKEAAQALVASIQSHDEGAAFMHHLPTLKPHLGKVDTGTGTIPDGLCDWLTAFAECNVSAETKGITGALVAEIRKDPDATTNAIKPAMFIIRRVL